MFFLTDDINMAIKNNGNSVNFAKVRKKRIQSTAKYYLRNNGNGLTKLLNKDLISFIENNFLFKQ